MPRRDLSADSSGERAALLSGEPLLDSGKPSGLLSFATNQGAVFLARYPLRLSGSDTKDDEGKSKFIGCDPMACGCSGRRARHAPKILLATHSLINQREYPTS